MTSTKHESDRMVTWRSLPHKRQLSLLFLSRLVDILQTASLQSYLIYQLKSFDPDLPNSTLASRAGVVLGSFTAAQAVTAMMWARIADADWGGRKRVLLFGLIGTAISCVGFGFSESFGQAVGWRVLGGALNGVPGVVGTMTAETVREKRLQSQAFLLLPISFNVATLLGPVLGGLLADTERSYPGIVGPNSILGGHSGIRWMMAFPYALPNLLNAAFLLVVAICVFLGLEETLESRSESVDIGLHIGRYLGLAMRKSVEPSEMKVPMGFIGELLPPIERERKLPFRYIWTSNFLFTLYAQASFDFHTSAFNNLWPLFLSTPRYDAMRPAPVDRRRHLPFIFTGGLGMPSSNIGFATAMLGAIGLTLQLTLYPKVHRKLGTIKCYRRFCLLFPIAYALIPYLSIVPSSTLPPSHAGGLLVWLSIAVVLSLQVTARTFALPAAIVLLNSCAPRPSALSAVHGIGHVVSSAFRTMGPIVSGHWYGLGLTGGVVGGSWWAVSSVALIGWFASRRIVSE